MPRNPAFDDYILAAPEFARPVLTHLRDVVHSACPQVDEQLKWGHPSFEHKGPMCGMAAFKQHCVFGFWKHSLVFADPAAAKQAGVIAQQRGRITSLKDLPSKAVLTRLIKQAAMLNSEGIKVAREKKPKAPLVIPRDLAAAIKANSKAAAQFADFSYSRKKDYAQWITEAKTQPTREKRLATAVEWIAQGKSRNWKYER
ncbi:MAG: YdeI/OmpD-associated family protein [Phycisphaerales bacterium]